MLERSVGKILVAAALALSSGLLPAAAVAEPGRGGDYLKIARAYADYMITRGRDTYGKVHSPLFASAMIRKTGKVPSGLPQPNVLVKPWGIGRRDPHKIRNHDRNHAGASPLDDIRLYKLLYKLTEVTGEKRYAAEADQAVQWFLENTASAKTALYPWGTHSYWHFHTDRPGGDTHEYHHVWPFWHTSPDRLRSFARGLWDHQVADKDTGDYNRHARISRHGPGGGMEFPRTGACYIDVWARELARSKDPQMKRAILAVLKRWDHNRHPKTRVLAAASRYNQWCWIKMNLAAASIVHDAAKRVKPHDAELARAMFDFERSMDAEYLGQNPPQKILDVKGKGFLHTYFVDDRTPYKIAWDPRRQSTVALPDPKARPKDAVADRSTYSKPWFVKRTHAGMAKRLHDRYLRTENPRYKALYKRAVLDTADIYLTIEPETQWPVWAVALTDVIDVLLIAHEITGETAYLHRADHMGQWAVRLLFDDVSPLPKINSVNDWYESSNDIYGGTHIPWALLRLHLALKKARAGQPAAVTSAAPKLPAGPDARAFAADLAVAAKASRAAVLEATHVGDKAGDLNLAFGPDGKKALYLAWRKDTARLAMRISDVVADGHKEVVRQIGVVVRNPSDRPQKVTLTATLNDTYHDCGIEKVAAAVPAGKRMFLAARADGPDYIRELALAADGGKLAVERIDFVLAPRWSGYMICVPKELARGGRIALGRDTLHTEEPGSKAEQIVYTVTTAPRHGQVLLGEKAVLAGQGFTQADVSAGRLSYRHDGSATATDALKCRATTATGAVSAERTLDFRVYGAPTVTGTGPVKDVPPPVFWLDASDVDADGKADSLADGAPVKKWLDKSGRGLAATDGTPPTLKTNQLNERPVVRFDGKDDFLVLPADLIKLGSFTAFVVGRYGPATDARQAMLCGYRRNAGNTRLYIWRGEKSKPFGGEAAFAVADRNPAIQFPIDEKFHVHTLLSDAARPPHVEGWLDGTGVGTANPAKCNDAVDALWLGAMAPGRPWASHLNGDVAEVILYARPLADEKRQGVEKYLMDKWGLARAR